MKKIVIDLHKAEFGSLEFWLNQPLILLSGWLKIVNEKVKRAAR